MFLKTNWQTKKPEDVGHDTPFINIGTEKACLFLRLSCQLISILKNNKFLYYAIEESLKCASINCYSSGILAYSQVLNCFGCKAPAERHKIAHELLRHKPSESDYDYILKELKLIAENSYKKELEKNKDGNKFNEELLLKWQECKKEIYL